jgi:hypothetical protein
MDSYTAGHVVLAPGEPRNYREAVDGKDKEVLERSMEKEIQSHMKKGTWEVKLRLQEKNIIQS